MADEHDAVVERIEVGQHPRPLREPVEGEERPREEEQRREHGADDVVEVLERFREARHRDPEARPAEAGDPGDDRHGEHPPRWVEPEGHRDEHRNAAVDAGPGGDPERLCRHESSSVSTGAARIASYVRWNWYLTNVPNIAGNALEKSTAVATVPVPTNST